MVTLNTTHDQLHMHPHGHSGLDHPHITDTVNEAISKLAPFSAIILTVILVIFFLIRFYLLEGFLLPRLYGDKYFALNENNRRGFVNHHIAGAAKIIMLFATVYPFSAVTFGNSTVHDLLPGSNVITFGDWLIVIDQLFIAMYLFELLFRAKLSPVAVAHHTGAVLIAQSAVAMSLNWEHERDATIEFILCFVWGASDVIAEFWPHLAIILYRVYPTRHAFLLKVFRFACITTLTGTLVETITVMWLFGSLWSRWTLPFKVVTPILHVVFSAAQVWGSKNFRDLWLKQRELLQREEEEGGMATMAEEADSAKKARST